MAMVKFRAFLLPVVFCASMSNAAAEVVRPLHPIIAVSEDGSSLVMLLAQDRSEAARAFHYKVEGIEFHLQGEFKLVGGRMPKEAFISSDGDLITLDDWYAYGQGNVVVVYDNAGLVKQQYSLDQMYDEDEIDSFVETSSSVIWRCTIIVPRVFGNRLYIQDQLGQDIIVYFNDGRIRKGSESGLVCPPFP